MIYLDIYDEENHIYTPYNFLDFCGFECHYNDITGMYDVNGFVNGAVNIASFDDEEFAIAVTRSLYTLKAAAETEPQPEARPEARFIDIDMIIEELEKMEDEEEDEDLIEDVEESKNYCKIQDKELFVLCIFLIGVGVMFGVFLFGVFL